MRSKAPYNMRNVGQKPFYLVIEVGSCSSLDPQGLEGRMRQNRWFLRVTSRLVARRLNGRSITVFIRHSLCHERGQLLLERANTFSEVQLL